MESYKKNFVNEFQGFRYYFSLENDGALHLNKLECLPFTQGCSVPSLIEIDPVIVENKIFEDFIKVISLFHDNLPLEKGGTLYLKKVENLFTKCCFVPSLVEISPVVLKK